MNHFELLIYRSRHQEFAVRDQTFNCKQGTACTHQIRWLGKNTPTFSTSDTLPDGYSLTSAGVLSYDGTDCTPNTYTIDVVADDGETTVTATMTINMAYATLTFEAQSFEFEGEESGSATLECTSDFTPSFAVTSGTLPAGVTLSSDGTLSYDGTYTQDIETSVSITASAQFAQSVTATISFKIALSLVPDDYIWYTPFTTDYTEETSGITGVAGQPNAFSIATDSSKFGSGYLAARKTSNDTMGIEYANTKTYMDLSAGTITISLWLRAPYWAQYSQLLGGTRPSDGSAGFVLFEDYAANPRIDFRSATNTSRGSTNVNVDADWHHWLFTRTAQGAWTWYKDGVLATSGTGDTGSINGNQQNMKIGGGTNWSKQAYFDLAHFRVYNRVLDSYEITALAGEF